MGQGSRDLRFCGVSMLLHTVLRILEVTGPSSCCDAMVELLKKRVEESDEVIAVRWATREMRDLDAERDRDESICEKKK